MENREKLKKEALENMKAQPESVLMAWLAQSVIDDEGNLEKIEAERSAFEKARETFNQNVANIQAKMSATSNARAAIVAELKTRRMAEKLKKVEGA